MNKEKLDALLDVLESRDDKETNKVGCEWNAWFYPEEKCATKRPFVMKCEGKCK